LFLICCRKLFHCFISDALALNSYRASKYPIHTFFIQKPLISQLNCSKIF
jgi:hypothetical protein